MGYVTGAYLVKKYPEVLEALGGYPNTKIDTAIQEASDEIDLYIGNFLPLATVPTILLSLCADITMYRAKQDEVTDIDADRYQEALDKLKEIRDGNVRLVPKAIKANECPAGSVRSKPHLSLIDTGGY
jgi:phage gp36-like protein